MRIGKYEININFINEWNSLNAIWNKNISYNWYDMTLVKFHCDFTKTPKDLFNFSVICKDQELKKRFCEVLEMQSNVDYTLEFTFGLFGLILNLIIERFKK